MKRSMDAYLEGERKTEPWSLQLYVLNQDPKSVRALENVIRICEERIPGRYTLEVVDLAVNPQLAKTDQIVALPTLVKKLPKPGKRIIGDFSDADRVLAGLGIFQA